MASHFEHSHGVPRPIDGPAWLVLPTFDEAGNLERMIDAALPVLLQAAGPLGARILVVDDDSPDGTGHIADRLAAEHPEHIEVLHRTDRAGLGPAYLAGFARALEAGAGLILEMDCDFSHDPRDLARLIDTVRRGADVALGSRYTRHGAVADWGLVRRLVSRGGSAYAQVTLGLKVKDLTGGFKCFRREVLEAIELDTVRAHGYAFQVELTYRAVRLGFRVVEVPITFRDREQGYSKMSWRIAVEAIGLVPQLRHWKPRS